MSKGLCSSLFYSLFPIGYTLFSRYGRYAYGMDEVWKRYKALP